MDRSGAQHIRGLEGATATALDGQQQWCRWVWIVGDRLC
jgi:hypothetical protein